MKVLYTGSFSPWHNGHQYVYDEACKYFGKENVYIGIGVNRSKNNIINLDFLKWTLVPVTKNVITYEGLTYDACSKNKIDLIIRGIRPGKSLEYEEDLYYWNQKLGNINTIFIPTPPEVNQISSSVIRELRNYRQVNLNDYVNPDVYYRWKLDYISNDIIYFGKSCCGKSTYLNKYWGGNCPWNLFDCDKYFGNYIDFDKLNTYLSENLDFNFEFDDIRDLKRTIKSAIQDNRKDDFYFYMEGIGNTIYYKEMFSKGRYFDAPAIGQYFNYIPKDIIGKFRLVKITNTEENRILYAKAKGWEPEYLKQLDKFYSDPPYWDEEINLGE